MSSSPPLLTVHLYVDDRDAVSPSYLAALNELMARLQATGIATLRGWNGGDPLSISTIGPSVFVSMGESDRVFAGLYAMPLADRRRWLHYRHPADIQPDSLLYCWLAATEPLPSVNLAKPSQLASRPLVSVFTAAYRTGQRIQRPYQSLLNQTYDHWEWVVVDDSGDERATYDGWLKPLADPRIRVISRDRRSGYIGTVKREAADQCRGQILVELDHDDELTPDCLARLVQAFQRHPECGFAFGEAAEIYEETGDSHWYGWDAGFGFLTYWRQYDASSQRCVNVPRTPGINSKTVTHLIGLPNHPRAWTRACYDAAGGHRRGLSVADDYDLIIRSLLCTRALRVPQLLYLQYRNAGGSNQTFQRNAQIQQMCASLEQYYRPRIQQRLAELGLPSLVDHPYRRVWTCPDGSAEHAHADVVDQGTMVKTAYLLYLPLGESAQTSAALAAALRSCAEKAWQDCELVVVGDVPEALLEPAAATAPPGSLRWWKTDASWPQEDHIRYGRLLCRGLVVECLLT